MAHKVHPKSFRLKRMKDWKTRGFYGKNTSKYLEEDFLIKKFLSKKLEEGGVESIEIEREQDNVKIIIRSSRPGLIIGRGGKGVEKLNKLLEKYLKKEKKKRGKKVSLPQIKIEIKEVRNPWTSAPLTADWITQQIEKRVPFRKVLKRAINKVFSNNEVKGVRIELSGRLNGSEIARTEWLKKGRLPRQNLRSDIDYSLQEAYCKYGTIGVKVWIYKGEGTAD